jgi:hypothetical protein
MDDKCRQVPYQMTFRKMFGFHVDDLSSAHVYYEDKETGRTFDI